MFIGHAQQKTFIYPSKMFKKKVFTKYQTKRKNEKSQKHWLSFLWHKSKRHIKDCKKNICPTFPSLPSYKNLQALDAGLKNLAITD